MFVNLYEAGSGKRLQIATTQHEAEDCEQWQVPPAQTEPLPSGLIADEV
jgi:hypothetical protein